MSKVQVAYDESLYRRYYSTPEKRFSNPDGSPHSRIFKPREKDNGEVSVDVKSLTTAAVSISDPSKYVLFEIANSDVVDLGLDTFHDPLLDGSNDAHAVIIGIEMDDDIKPGLLARKSKRVLIIV